MDCVTLGTGGMMPMPLRLTTSVLIRREGRMLMFDAGEGIQIALKRGGFGIAGLDAVAITHMHADHVLGLPGILMFRSQTDTKEPLTVIGPPGIGRFVGHTLKDLRYHLSFDIEFIEWSGTKGSDAWIWQGAGLIWEPLDHSAFCVGYRLEEPARPGKFHVEKAEALGVPEGALFGKLQAGETVVLNDGRSISPDQVLGPPRRGRIAAFATDTRPCSGLGKLLRGADIAFVEGMFAAVHEAEAREKSHMTAAQAALEAAAAGVKRLVLVHISPRYKREDESVLEAEARALFPGAEVARPLFTYSVPLPD